MLVFQGKENKSMAFDFKKEYKEFYTYELPYDGAKEMLLVMQ